MELIDTLWNVNKSELTIISPLVSGINRYIMECKYWWTGTAAASTVELIDTLWNVNSLPGLTKIGGDLMN